MVFVERISAPATDSERAVVRLLRHYTAMRDHDGESTSLSRLVALGRSLVIECCCSRFLSMDERAVIRLIGSRMPTLPGTATPDIPHGLPGALAWAVLSVRRLCSNIVPHIPKKVTDGADGCPFTPAAAA